MGKQNDIKNILKKLMKKELRQFKRYLRKKCDGYKTVLKLTLQAIASKLSEDFNEEQVSSMIKEVQSKRHRTKNDKKQAGLVNQEITWTHTRTINRPPN